jgi:hypothetical protein
VFNHIVEIPPETSRHFGDLYILEKLMEIATAEQVTSRRLPPDPFREPGLFGLHPEITLGQPGATRITSASRLPIRTKPPRAERDVMTESPSGTIDWRFAMCPLETDPDRFGPFRNLITVWRSHSLPSRPLPRRAGFEMEDFRE